MANFKKVNVLYKYDENDVKTIESMFAGVFRYSALSENTLEQERVLNTARFAALFVDNIFQDEYAVLYELAVTRRLNTGVWESYKGVIEENKNLILSAQQVNINKYKADYNDADIYDAFMKATQDAYDRICSMPFVGAEGFRSATGFFIEVFEHKYMRQCLNIMGAILNSPDPYIDYRGGRRREYQGYTGSNEFYMVERQRLTSLRGTQNGRQFLVNSDWLRSQLDPEEVKLKAARRELLCTLDIDEIDNVWSGVRRTHVVGIIGPPKGGKTTLSAFIAFRLLQAGRKVAIWAMEGSAEESWINKLIAAYCFDKGYDISTKDLEDGLIGRAKEDSMIVLEARSWLAKNTNLSFIEETGYVEDFLEVIDGHYRAFNRFDAIIVDSLLNLQTRTGRRKSEYLSSAHILFKDYIEHHFEIAPAGIITAQFKQESIKEARNAADIVFDEISGGETAETIRTPDDVLGLFALPKQKDTQYTTLYHIASRHSKQFPKFEIRALFGNGYFTNKL